jgi:hypothetical protein
MKNRSILCSCISDAPLSPTLNLLGSIPDDLRKRKLANESNHDSDDIMSCTRSTVMRYEALAVIIHFLSLDCTVSFISTNTSNTSSARKFRKSIIAAPTGPSGSVAHDFIVFLNSSLRSHQEQYIDSSLRSSVSSSSQMMFSGLSSTDNIERIIIKTEIMILRCYHFRTTRLLKLWQHKFCADTTKIRNVTSIKNHVLDRV